MDDIGDLTDVDNPDQPNTGIYRESDTNDDDIAKFCDSSNPKQNHKIWKKVRDHDFTELILYSKICADQRHVSITHLFLLAFVYERLPSLKSSGAT